MNNELLSPAGTITSFYAAISSGANAIYLGIKKFNARAYASNFSLEELKELVKFAHLRNVKIYVTMNTILYDEPTAGLDPISSTLIEDYIVRLKEETHAASIVVTHQMSTIQRTANKVIMLYDGKIVYAGTPEDMLKQNTPYTKQFVTASLEGPMQMIAEN